jgi:uncharacterized protein YcaQ
MSREDLSLSEARRIALAAQGFDRPRPSVRVDARHVRRTIRQLGLLQIDYVNVLVPAHYQPLFSRLGTYDRTRLDALVYRRREFTEQWAHEASIVPVERWPLLRYRAETQDRRIRALSAFLQQHPRYVERVLREVRARGPVTADDIPAPVGAEGRRGREWGWTFPKVALESLFVRGKVAVADRQSNFARVFDLAERVLPTEQYARTVGRAEAERELLRLAARAHGVGTAGDLADYYRMSVRDARPHLDALVAAGALRAVRVEGWREPVFLHVEARTPRRIAAAALLSPFDPVVWYRPRVARLFEFDYRIEIFVPRAKRTWGYYVLPFLLGDRLVARVDLKADRPGRRLWVQAAYIERGCEPDTVAPSLAAELWTMAAWLGLDAVSVGRRGGFARRLAAQVRASPR